MVLGTIPTLRDWGILLPFQVIPSFAPAGKQPRSFAHILGNCFEFPWISLPFPLIPSLSKESPWIPIAAPWEIPKFIKNTFNLLFLGGYFRGKWNNLRESKQLEVAFCGVQRLDFSSLDDSLIPHILWKKPGKKK